MANNAIIMTFSIKGRERKETWLAVQKRVRQDWSQGEIIQMWKAMQSSTRSLDSRAKASNSMGEKQ